MRKGFQLLHTRSLDNPVGEYDIQLPEMYRLFIEMFEVGNNSLFEEKYLNTMYNQKRIARSCLYTPMEEIWFAGFNTIKDSLEVKKDREELVNSKFLPIGYCAHNAGIIVSLEGDDKDVIYFEENDITIYDEDDPNNPEDLVRLSDNIFEFVKGLELPIADDVDPSNFYKNWHEDFWRMRE